MKAALAIAVAQAVFGAGTTGGDWLWSVETTDGLDGPSTQNPITWNTAEPYTSISVEPETTYLVKAQRLSVEKEPLGPMTQVKFTTEAEPVKVVIDVAGPISVEVTE